MMGSGPSLYLFRREVAVQFGLVLPTARRVRAKGGYEGHQNYCVGGDGMDGGGSAVCGFVRPEIVCGTGMLCQLGGGVDTG